MQKIFYILVLMSFILVGCGGDDAAEAITNLIDPDAPVLASIGNKTVTSGDTLTFTVTATDPNNFVYSLASDGTAGTNGNPYVGHGNNNAQFLPGTGEFSWNTMNVATGDYSVEFSVMNSVGLSDSETIVITIQQQQGQFQLGETLYNAGCERCHGPAGRFGSPGGEIQCIDNVTYNEKMNGGNMEQYGPSWSTADKDAVLFYLQNVDASRC